MGISFSNNRRRNNPYFQHPHHPPPPPYYYSDQQPPPPPPPPLPPPPHNYGPYPPPHHPYPVHPSPPPPPPPPQNYYYCGSTYANPMTMTARFNYNQHPHPYVNHTNGWLAPSPRPQAVDPPRYVDHQNAKKVRNDVNINKDTLKLVVDEQNPDHVLVSFVFDALHDGSITIFYFAKEESNCRFVPFFPANFTPVKIPFQKGFGQRFCQPSGTGIDLGFFELDDLSKPSPGEDVFPLVVSAETLPPHSTDKTLGECVPNTNPHMQITQAVLEKNNDEHFQVRVVKQILWIDGFRYELREIYGIGSSEAEGFDDSDPGKECVICMTEPKDTAVLPCRHMCMCSECAKALRLQSNKCPICRQPIEELLEIKIHNGDQ